MSKALQVFHKTFDDEFFKLQPKMQERIETKVDDMGLRLDSFPHHRLTGSERCRLRVSDYRVINRFDAKAGVIHLLSVGHRREIYR